MTADLDQIRARADAATPGPWTVQGNGITTIETTAGPFQRPFADANASFIAHARTDVPALLDTLQAVLDLHPPTKADGGKQICLTCGGPFKYVLWPCPTRRLIERTGP